MLKVSFVPWAEARALRGLRLVVNDRAPSAWSEGAKALFVYKRIPFVAAAFKPADPELVAWLGTSSAPVAFYDDEPARSSWRDILALSERLGPTPTLLPADAQAQAEMLTLLADVFDPGGLLWCRRLQLVHAGLLSGGEEGFSLPTAQYLAPKYGYRATEPATFEARVSLGLAALASRLAASGPFFYGADPLALDFYIAALMGAFAPLPDEVFETARGLRRAFSFHPPAVKAALAPALLEHRDRVLARLVGPA